MKSSRQAFSPPDLSLYIHIPFCKTICLYCNFLTFANKQAWITQYVEQLCVEIEHRARQYQNYEIQTVFFGGGTPSLIEPMLINKIVHKAKESFNIRKNPEISIECNPESVDAHRLAVYQDAGITRFSLGVQSLNKKTLKRVIRPHDRKTIFTALGHFKNARIKNFGTDFIMGLPGQTLASFKRDVETLLSFEPAHLSFYFLSYDTKKIDLFIKECPGEDEQIRMYDWLCKKLNKHGFTHYEVSNWARAGFECEHNKRYWEQKDYLGLGVGAHSIVNGTMWQNQQSFDGYLRDPMTIRDELPIDAELKRMEYLMLRLRTHEGIDLAWYETFGSVTELLKDALPFQKSGHLKKIGNRLASTEKGFLIADELTKMLI